MIDNVFKGIAFLCFVIAFNSCNAPRFRNLNQIDTSFCDSISLGKTENCLVNIYDIDPLFNNLLDSIINQEVKYPYYNNCYSSFLYSTSDIVPEGIPETELICFSAINRYRYNFNQCYGIFKFKGWYFICDNSCNRKFLKATNKKMKVDYLVNDTTNWRNELNDNYSNWMLVERKGKIEIVDSYQPYYPIH
jgi:hypothetical protein